jgi:hypothetical protein
MYMLYSCMLTLKYLYIFMINLRFTSASPLLIYVTDVILFHLNIFIYTPTFLVLYYYFSCCVCRLTGLVECVDESEGLRRDGGWEHGVLQQRAAGEAPLHEPPHVSLLGGVQANTRLTGERTVRPLVVAAVQVREMDAARASYDARLPNLVSLRMAEEAAGREYM